MKFSFGEAIMDLSRISLISRSPRSKALSMHRLVQFAIFANIPKTDRTFYFDSVISILYFGFANTWQKRGPHQGHGWEAWETCRAILPHVSRLMQISEKHKVKAAQSDQWAELIFRAGT